VNAPASAPGTVAGTVAGTPRPSDPAGHPAAPAAPRGAPARPLRARVLYTRYPHLGAYAGHVQFARHFDPARVRALIIAVADGDDDFPPRFPFRDWRARVRLRDLVQSRGMGWYKLSDLYAEWRTLGACALGRADVVHFVDGEHTPQFTPPLLAALGGRRGRTVATYHQPPDLLGSLVDRRVLRRLDLVTVVSPTQREWFADAAPGVRVEVVPHGIDAGFFSPAPDRPPGGPAERPAGVPFRCITVGHWLRDWNAVRAVAERFAGDRGDRGVEFHVVTPHDPGLDGLPNVVRHQG
jgi:glycosyltransferase involved in cell wall biosynthesis